ncbi:MAG: RHS repeat domain-containing protein [Nitrospiria bacterium]
MSTQNSTYEYDQNGNRTHQSTQEAGAWIQPVYEYDAENRLTRIIDQRVDQFTLIDYQYDPFGRRIGKWIETYDVATGVLVVQTFSYTYDNEDIIVREKTTVQNNVTTTETTNYLHGPGIDEPLMAETGQGTTTYHADGLGSVVALTDGAQQVVERYRYSSFGEITILNGQIDNPYTFTGREWDAETGLYYYRARFYDAETGRFLSFDPILRGIEHTTASSCTKSLGSFPLKQPQELNPYVYVGNNPLLFTDPLGLARMCCRLLNSIAGSVFGQRHCYIIADDGTRYGLYPENGIGVPRTNDPRDTGGDCYDCPAIKSSCPKQNECLRKAHNSYPTTSYSLLGPNSNTYAGSLARSCCQGGVPSGVHSAPGVNSPTPGGP